jgi:hypothetical protein
MYHITKRERDILAKWKLFSILQLKDKVSILKTASKNNVDVRPLKKVKVYTSNNKDINKLCSLLHKNPNEINQFLFDEGLCPLLFYGFSKRFSVKTISDVILIIEISTFYLYKTIKFNRSASTLIKNGFLVKKSVNFAERFFLHKEEFSTFKKLKRTQLAGCIPICKYTDRLLSRTYIIGPTGHELLKNNLNIDNHLIKQLKFIYHQSIHLSKEQIYLDIHPGNFCWSNNKLFLFDLGPIPAIGFNYFIEKSFKFYYQKVWLDRLHNMKKYPIRSFAL